MDRIRHFINECWLNYPEKERLELLSRLRSREGYRSATFEMLLHESLLKTGCTLEHHPDIGTSTTPDFYVKSPGGDEFILEAVLASEVNDLKPSVEALKEQVFDRLDANIHHDFFIEIRDSGEPTQAPRSKVFSNQVISWLNTLNYESLRNEFEKTNFEKMPCTEWELNGWQLKIRPMPVSEERRGKTTSLIAVLPTRGGFVNSWEPLRDALIKKNGKYGKVNLPLIIAVNFGRFYLSDIDEIQALYGSEKIFVSTDQEAEAKIIHEPNGAWMGPKGPQCTRTSGAWFFTDLNWYSAERCVQKLYTNPWAKHETPKYMRNFPTCAVCSDGSIVRNDGVSIGSILKLPTGWPE